MTALTGFTVLELANERIAFAGKLLAYPMGSIIGRLFCALLDIHPKRIYL